MTTLAYHHKSKKIACDGRIVSHGLIKSDSFNKTIINDIGMWMFCGSASDTKDLCILNHNDKVDVIPDCSAFLVTDGKCFDVIVNKEGYCEYFQLNHNDSKGSGGELALAAMDFGRSAKKAVEYAMTRDIYSGGKVSVYDIEKGKFI